MLPLILASSSSARKTLLQRLAIPFQVLSPDIDETPLVNETPTELALRLAQQKAQAVAKRCGDAIIIGADQVIMCENTRLDKPGNKENAVKQLMFMRNKTITSFTGLCVLNSQTQQQQTQVVLYHVTLRNLTATMIDYYLQHDQPFACAGSVKAESLGIALFKTLAGADFTALIGLPLMALTDMLLQENIPVLG